MKNPGYHFNWMKMFCAGIYLSVPNQHLGDYTELMENIEAPRSVLRVLLKATNIFRDLLSKKLLKFSYSFTHMHIL